MERKIEGFEKRPIIILRKRKLHAIMGVSAARRGARTRQGPARAERREARHH
jgi:hypothetical protein